MQRCHESLILHRAARNDVWDTDEDVPMDESSTASFSPDEYSEFDAYMQRRVELEVLTDLDDGANARHVLLARSGRPLVRTMSGEAYELDAMYADALAVSPSPPPTASSLQAHAMLQVGMGDSGGCRGGLRGLRAMPAFGTENARAGNVDRRGKRDADAAGGARWGEMCLVESGLGMVNVAEPSGKRQRQDLSSPLLPLSHVPLANAAR